MPRDGSNIYHRPPGTDGIPNYTVESARYNAFAADVEQDLNLPRPVVAGGTGASTPDGALDSLSAEKFKQVVANWDSNLWRAGSFYAATTASGIAPVAGHAFAGIAYYANPTDFVLKATDLTDPANPVEYTRVMAAGVWSAWSRGGATGTSGSQIGEFLFDTGITFPPPAGTIRFNNATQNSTTELFISHLTATGIDITTSLPFALKNGYDVAIADKVNIANYKIFTITADPVLSGGDIRVLAKLKTAGLDLTATRVLLNATPGSSVRYDIAQSLTSETAPYGTTLTQRAQARQNIYAAPFDALSYNGMQVNGSMEVSQELGGAARTTSGYVCDGWLLSYAGSMVINAATYVNPAFFSGFSTIIAYGPTTAQPSLGASDYCILTQRIEGRRMARLAWGRAGAQPITIAFWTQHVRPGVYTGSIRNPAAYNRVYTFSYTQNLTEVAQYNVITIPGDTAGTWVIDNTAGIEINFAVAAGTAYTAPSANAWLAGSYLAAPGQINGVVATSDQFRISGVVVLPGVEAPSAARSAFIMRPYDQELQTCKRYYEIINGQALEGYQIAGGYMAVGCNFKVSKRAIPTMGAVGWVTTGNATNQATGGATTEGFFFSASAISTGTMYFQGLFTVADARL